ncbi:MAG: methyltransferase domain-containing protein [Deltaproteobacteria bacterium]|nr:methyltransferase domain-containing protein [Deltaproteobacteria bacterium]
MTAEPGERPEPRLEDFLGKPTRRLEDWHWLWMGDQEFPIRSHRGFWGRILVSFKRFLRPFTKIPQNDLWERQRVFNLVLAEHLIELRQEQKHQRFLGEETNRQAELHRQRTSHLEAFMDDGLKEIMRHNDALFSRVDQKLDLYRRRSKDLADTLGGALAALGDPDGATSPGGGGGVPSAATESLARAWDEHTYLELERRYRGTVEEIEQRLAVYLPFLEGVGPVLDLGCGRGESLLVLGRQGIPCRGVDGSREMVQHCRQLGLEVEEGDLFNCLEGVEPGSLGAVVSFHVIEHLPAPSLDRLVRLAFRALAPGGVLVLETPNPLSVVVAARNFWLDPTHQRPIHPDSLRLSYELAGFEKIEHLELRPFAEADRLPEIDLTSLPEEQRKVADRVNRLRDRLDELLFGFQDYSLVGVKGSESQV